MKTTRLLSTVAASLLLTAGIASAQMPKGDEQPGKPPAAQQKAPAEKSAPAIRGGEQKAPGAPGRQTQEMKPGEHKAPATTGQGAAGAAAKLSPEQRTKVTTIFKQQKVARVEPSTLNITINIGTRVPDHVRFYPLPQEVIVIYPEWRGYDYILVGDQILVIEPGTHEIVAILEA